MSKTNLSIPITAIIYGDGAHVAPTLDRIARHLADKDYRLAGLLQRDAERAGRSRCDMLMENLTSGEIITISQDRGEGARGCRLDVEALLMAVARVRATLMTAPDLLIVNKFGKTECEGGGCRSLLVEAIDLNVPVLVAVPVGNLDGWRRFAGEYAVEYAFAHLPHDAADLCRYLALAGSLRDPSSPAIGEHAASR